MGDMEVMDMEDLMEVMLDIEAMVVMDMEREKLKLMLSQDMVMEVMAMEDLMEVMVMEREMLSQVMDMVVMEDMVMEDHMDTEAMDMVVMVMESNQVFLLNATPIIKLLLTEQN